MAPKKNVKMDLGSFLADDSLGGGSWADEEVDMSSISVQLNNNAPSSERSTGDYGRSSYSSGNSYRDESRPERKEFPVPDQPPYRARIGNLPWDIVEDDVKVFFEKRMQMQDFISDVKLPVDPTGRLKGYGFVTFNERELLEEALQLTLSDFNGRKIFVNVAAPQNDLNWGSARSSGLRRGEEDDQVFDFAAARSERVSLPPRERFNRGPSRRQEAESDWSTARGGEDSFGQRERRPRREEPVFDFAAARSERASLPPRERPERAPRKPSFKKAEPEFDWSAARTEKVALPQRESTREPPRERYTRKPKEPEQEFDWGAARHEKAALPPRAARKPKTQESPAPSEQGPQKSSFGVLAVEGDSDAEEEKPEIKTEKQDTPVKSLEQETAKLSVQDNDDGEWEVVRK